MASPHKQFANLNDRQRDFSRQIDDLITPPIRQPEGRDAGDFGGEHYPPHQAEQWSASVN